MGKGNIALSFDAYCSTYGKDPKSGEARQQYDTYVGNITGGESLDSLHRSGKTPNQLFDKT